MSWTNITNPASGEATKKSLADAIIGNLVYIYNQITALFSGSTILNGSFENQIAVPGTPDGWTVTINSGGAFALDTTHGNVAHGSTAAKFTSSGTLGASIESTDYFKVTPVRTVLITWQMVCSSATLTNKMEIEFFDYEMGSISTATLYNASTGNPIAYTLLAGGAVPPAGARYAKLKFTGANSATSGSTWLDDIRMTELPTGSVPNAIQLFTSNGTYTVPNYATKVRVTCIGGGGGGTAGSVNGGGSGAYCESIVTVTPGSAVTVTIGAGGAAGADGGNTSFGSSVVAGGGKTAGTGGTATTGDIAITGNANNVLTGGIAPKVGGVNPGDKPGRGGNASGGAGSDGWCIVES